MERDSQVDQLIAVKEILEGEVKRLKQENELLRAHNTEIHEHLRTLMRQGQANNSVVRVSIDTVEDLIPLMDGIDFIGKMELHKAAKAAGNDEVSEFLELQGIGLT